MGLETGNISCLLVHIIPPNSRLGRNHPHFLKKSVELQDPKGTEFVRISASLAELGSAPRSTNALGGALPSSLIPCHGVNTTPNLTQQGASGTQQVPEQQVLAWLKLCKLVHGVCV